MKQCEEDMFNLKRDLQNSIDAALQRFQDRTGLTPSAINVHMTETTWVGDGIKRFALSNVTVRFEA